MGSRRPPLIVLAIAAVVVLAAAGARCKRPGEPAAPAWSGVMLSLGDSVAAGNGASDPAATSFAALVARDEGVELVNLAVAGATTQDVLDAQLPRADERLAGRRVAFVTVSVGGNDLAALIPNAACVQEPLPASCPLDETLRGVGARYRRIVATLRSRYPQAPVVLLAYPNFFSGTGHPFEAPAGCVLPRLDAAIRAVAADDGGRHGVAEAAPAFEGRGGELTHVLDPASDPHPDDAGHRAIADAFEAALDGLR